MRPRNLPSLRRGLRRDERLQRHDGSGTHVSAEVVNWFTSGSQPASIWILAPGSRCPIRPKPGQVLIVVKQLNSLSKLIGGLFIKLGKLVADRGRSTSAHFRGRPKTRHRGTKAKIG